ncbi:MAG: hypothetical protein HQL69_18300 [Magnetococcales bacterium]|nr:hypothetical protein [Magnetococcales bacterium]
MAHRPYEPFAPIFICYLRGYFDLALNAVATSAARPPVWLRYENNLIPQVLFWPLIFGVLRGLTGMVFQ